MLQQFEARRKHKPHSHANVRKKDINLIKQKMQNITNNNNTTCHFSDSGLKLGVANSDRLHTSVLVRINESCLI